MDSSGSSAVIVALPLTTTHSPDNFASSLHIDSNNPHHSGNMLGNPTNTTTVRESIDDTNKDFTPKSSWLPSTSYTRLTLFAVMTQAVLVIIMESIVYNQFTAAIDTQEPGPARGIPVYLVIFLLAQVFQIILCWDALIKQNTMQIGSFVAFNLANLSYAIFQYAQLIRIATADIGLSTPLIVIPVIIAVFQILFIFLASKLYIEFGWTIFKRIGADPFMRSMYRTYQIFVLLIKIDVFFVVGFGIQFVVLVIKTYDPEFGITIAAIPVILLILALAVYGIRKEDKIIVSCFLFGLFLAIAYFIFKIVRIYTRPAQYADTKYYLTFFAVLSLTMVISTFFTAIKCIQNFGKGLAAHLAMTIVKEEPTDSPVERVPFD
ncbi:hypothetical protein BASA50_007221 [Batrachochytrium salamandrivorans]|uniref:TRP C-terminal domain-containing protein n=1 Tax=Batrachochytrium salamandrivorans TaxID=1357716 RepID=A0ABQ8F7P9_9FUNG|nr:hypothetical protein BASA50_007221 [Batrachochytrium salamandrivorans]KAH9274284.1 hypothetical protein BASA83_003280 [Batrachochytrium salamandrivorans]